MLDDDGRLIGDFTVASAGVSLRARWHCSSDRAGSMPICRTGVDAAPLRATWIGSAIADTLAPASGAGWRMTTSPCACLPDLCEMDIAGLAAHVRPSGPRASRLRDLDFGESRPTLFDAWPLRSDLGLRTSARAHFPIARLVSATGRELQPTGTPSKAGLDRFDDLVSPLSSDTRQRCASGCSGLSTRLVTLTSTRPGAGCGCEMPLATRPCGRRQGRRLGHVGRIRDIASGSSIALGYVPSASAIPGAKLRDRKARRAALHEPSRSRCTIRPATGCGARRRLFQREQVAARSAGH